MIEVGRNENSETLIKIDNSFIFIANKNDELPCFQYITPLQEDGMFHLCMTIKSIEENESIQHKNKLKISMRGLQEVSSAIYISQNDYQELKNIFQQHKFKIEFI